MTSRSTRLTIKGQRTRQRIVDAASRVVDAQGIGATRLEDVRREANVSSSQIYHYFADKHSLMLAVVDEEADPARSHSSMTTNFTSVDAIQAWGHELIDRQGNSPYRNVCPILEMDSAADGLHDRALAGLLKIEHGIRDGYRTMQQQGELAGHVDCDSLAAATVVTMFGGVRLAQLRRDLGPLTAAVDNVSQMLTSASRSDRNSLQRDDFGFEIPKSSS
jgi:TetR/AcrR family transcriptional regulator, transcriptional repressor for nem operon